MISESKISRKGIVLAGGAGSRLYPLTKGVSKQLLPVYDKPMVYYPLSILMLAGIRDILIISTEHDSPILKKILGNGSNFGVNLQYEIQYQPDGIASALIIAEEFLENAPSALVLGDNLIIGQDLSRTLSSANNVTKGASIFGYSVKDPTSFGVVEFDNSKKVISIEEKPEFPKSNYAVPGLYFYDSKASEYAKTLIPSARGELEITDLNNLYLKKGELNVEILGRGTAWLDMGTHESLFKAASYIQSVQSIHGSQIGNLEEIGFNNNWISKEDLLISINSMSETDYAEYLYNLVNY